jgi:PHD/YefM family antitoxin component YafN of YafNO toxin-antitoxin module
MVARNIWLDKTNVITHAFFMQTVTATKARSMIYKLLDDAADSHEPIQITGKRSNAVLVAEDDWRAIQESLYLVSIPGMRESIRAGLATPVDACATKLDW